MPPTRHGDRSDEHGIGLRNVNERLRVIYGANYQLHLHSVPGQGTLGAHRDSRAASSRTRHGLTMRAIRVLVVDDEQLAREELCFLLGQAGGVEIVGQAADGVEALRLAGELRPDVVFLDVQMPGLTGFEVARRLIEADVPPQLVFVTAFDQYAIDAFAVNAVDYVLKPVDADRLEQTLDRVAAPAGVRAGGPAAALAGRPRAGRSRPSRPAQGRRDQLAIRAGERFVLVQADEVVHASLVDEAIVVVTNSVSGHV